MTEINDLQSNYKSGWIKIYRSIRKHWLWPKNRPLTELEAWITILIEVNHESEKCRIGCELLNCQRGEKYYSLDTWAKLFNWHKSKVRRFFILLQNDSMIVLKSVQKTTHLTVCNYESYQSMQNDNETIVKRKRNDRETMATPIEELKNDKELKNLRNNTWRNNFEIYKFELLNWFEKIKTDNEYLKEQEKFNPNVDIILSIEKSINVYWGTEAGWKNKKKNKETVNINWKHTIAKNLDKNKVYKQLSKNGNNKQQYEPEFDNSKFKIHEYKNGEVD